jgi:hypothetical protein
MTGRKFISGSASDTRRDLPSHKGSWPYRHPPWSVQLEVSTCHARTIANRVRTRMLINKRRFSKNLLIDSFGGGTLSMGTRRIAVVFHPLDLR